MKKLLILLLLFVCNGYNSVACFNTYYAYNKAGHAAEINVEVGFEKNFDREAIADRLSDLENLLKNQHNYMTLSDYAVNLCKLGKQKEALQILAELYRHYPTEYQIAANLGTAYELNGQNDSALKYIKRDLELNQNDHEGSEWIHVKILEAKLQLQKNPGYLNTTTVLQLNGKQLNDSLIFYQLKIQLMERVPFTNKGSDPIMSSLFNDFGNLSANLNSIEYARAYYLIAKKYYGDQSPELNKKIKSMEALINKYVSANKNPPKNNNKIIEGNDDQPLGYISYQQMLYDYEAYEPAKINWSKINTDVPALLKLVDFTKSPVQAKTMAAHSTSANDSLKLIPEEKDTAASAKPAENTVKSSNTATATPANNNTLIYILLAAIVFITGIFFGWKKLKKQ